MKKRLKQVCKTLLLSLLFSMVGANAFAHDIEVKNADGVTIYYNIINGAELQVTSRGVYYIYEEYSGSVVIPESVTYEGQTYSVTSIDHYAFYDCRGLTSVTIPSSVTSIGSYAFWYCSGLKKVIVKDLAAWCGISFGNSGLFSNPLYYAQHLYSDEDTEITDLVIPDGVTSIGSNAFEYCSGLKKVTIPDGVTSIGDYAFYSCKNLTAVTIPNTVTTIGTRAFSICSALSEIVIGNSVTEIGYAAFSSCSALTEVTIPSNVTSIDDNAFSSCSNLKKIIFSDGSTRLNFKGGTAADINYSDHFSGTSLETLYLGRDIYYYWYGEIFPPFYKKTSLKSLTIGDSVTEIQSYAFERCSGLTEVTIGSSVEYIKEYAFKDCSSITSITSLNPTPPTITTRAFTTTTEQNATLYVPTGSKKAYQEADYWKNFYKIVDEAEESTGIDLINIDKQNENAIYTINGMRLNTTNISDLPSGIYIINGKKALIK